MQLNDFFLQSMQNLQTSAQDSALSAFKPEKAQSAGQGSAKSSFCDILGAASNSVSSARNAAKTTPNPVQQQMKADDGNPQPKTFRQVYDENRVKTDKNMPVKKVLEADESVTALPEDKDTEKAAPDNNSAAIINCLSQVLGMKPEELKDLFSSAGITDDDLEGADAVQNITAKLTAALKLDDGQSKALSQLFQMIMEGVSAAQQTDSKAAPQSSLQPVSDKANEAQSKQNNAPQPVIEVIRADTKADLTGLTALAAKFKAKLNDHESKLNDDPDSVKEDVSSLLSVSKQNDSTVKFADKSTDFKAGSGVNEAGAKAADDGMKQSQVLKPENGISDDKAGEKGKDTEKAAVSQTVPVQSTPSKDQGLQPLNPVQPNTQPALQKIDLSQDLLKTDTKVSVNPRDLLQQVVEKAKVVLTGDKSEMVMDLKPDSLGKLSLKVVTEHGMVMAQFVADNQQVKHVIETNMQTLKDSLQKQGLDVQGFSVSVRQDSQGGSQNRDDSSRTANQAQQRLPYMDERTGIAVEWPGSAKANPYNWNSSTINLTA